MKLEDARILVVDDEPLLRDIFSRWIIRSGCADVLVARNGAEALALMTQQHFDMLITDIHMPVMDGVQLVRTMKVQGLGIPSVIFVSGGTGPDRAEMYSLGVEKLLQKPFTMEILQSAVEISLAHRNELWRLPMSDDPTTMLIIDGTLTRSANEPTIWFGRGGFCAKVLEPIEVGPVKFVIRLGLGSEELRGQGHVRWYSRKTNSGGVEFDYLEPASRQRLLELVAADPLRGFLPNC